MGNWYKRRLYYRYYGCSATGDLRAVSAFHVRKALGYVFSVRAEYDWIRLRGLNYQPTQAYGKNPVLSVLLRQMAAGNQPIFYNYRSTVHELSFQGVFTLNNINFHKAKTGWNMYFFGGLGPDDVQHFLQDGEQLPERLMTIRVLINRILQWIHITPERYPERSSRTSLTGPWSTMAERPSTSATLGGAPLTVVGVAGMGFQFKLSNKVNIALEDKFTFTTTDLIDGQQWQNNYTPTAVNSIAQTRSADSYNFVSIGINYQYWQTCR